MSERRRPGRPRLVAGEQAAKVSLRLSNEVHDEACRIALRMDVSVSRVIRAALRRSLLNERGAYLSV